MCKLRVIGVHLPVVGRINAVGDRRLTDLRLRRAHERRVLHLRSAQHRRQFIDRHRTLFQHLINRLLALSKAEIVTVHHLASRGVLRSKAEIVLRPTVVIHRLAPRLGAVIYALVCKLRLKLGKTAICLRLIALDKRIVGVVPCRLVRSRSITKRGEVQRIGERVRDLTELVIGDLPILCLGLRLEVVERLLFGRESHRRLITRCAAAIDVVVIRIGRGGLASTKQPRPELACGAVLATGIPEEAAAPGIIVLQGGLIRLHRLIVGRLIECRSRIPDRGVDQRSIRRVLVYHVQLRLRDRSFLVCRRLRIGGLHRIGRGGHGR